MSPKLSRWKSVFPLACALISLAACSDDTEDPVRSKAQMLYGTWDLQAAQDVGEGDLEFSYTFQANGSVRNRIGGAFLAELRNIDAVRQALDALRAGHGRGLSVCDSDAADGVVGCVCNV